MSTKDETQLHDETKALVLQCQSIPAITNDTDYRRAGELLKVAAAFVKEVKAYFAPLKKQAQEMHKAIVAKEAQAIDATALASDRLRKLMADYQTELDRIARMERERIEAEQRAERERLEAELAAQAETMSAVEQAEVLEAMEAVQEKQIAVQVPEPPKVQGVSMRRIADTEKIAAHVKAHGDKEPIPGVYVWIEYKFSVANAALLPTEFTKLTTSVRS